MRNALVRSRRAAAGLHRIAGRSIEVLETRLLLSTYTVTTTADSGPGSLRDAIANSTAGTIVFGFSGTAPRTIVLGRNWKSAARSPSPVPAPAC